METPKKKKELYEEIALPTNVSAQLEKGVLTLEGARGEVKRSFLNKKIKINLEGNTIKLEAEKYNLAKKKIIKSYAAHIKNMIKGCLEPHKYVLKICSGHFPMNVSVNGNELVIKNFLGEKIPRILKLREGASVKVEGDKISVEGSNKEIVGQVSAEIEQLTRRTRYDSRIFQDGCYIVLKDGKEVN